MLFDPLYIIITLPAFLAGIVANLFLKFVYSKYSKVANINLKNGLDTATSIAHHSNFAIDIETIKGDMTDHYDPISRTVRLSSNVANNATVASVGIAAHELGHVEQHFKGFFLIAIRTIIAPIVGFGTNVGYLMLIAGLILGLLNLSYLGLILFASTTVFSLTTLPIELDASRRALRLISVNQLIPESQMGGVKMVLLAAALTYVAATFQSLSQFLYFFIRIQRRNN